MKFFILCVSLVLLPLNSFATPPYSWTYIPKDSFQFTEDAQKDRAMILEHIGQATTHIDLVTHDLRMDTYGTSVLDALRQAANRGVSVRLVQSGNIPKYYSDPIQVYRDAVENYLKYPATQVPIQYVFVGGLPLLMKGWSLFTTFHEKLLIIDQKIAFISGRNFADPYLTWLDTSFKFGPNASAILEQLMHVYESIWESANREVSYSPFIEEEVKDLPFGGDPSGPTPADQMKIRVLHHDLFNEVRRNCEGLPWIYNYNECAEYFEDPILEESIRLVQHAREFKFFTYSTVLHPDLRAALLERLRDSSRPFKLTIFTNSEDSHATWEPTSTPWVAGLRDLHDLLRFGAKVYGLNPTEGSTFLHRKMAIALMDTQDPSHGLEDAAIIGSYNLTEASHWSNSELSLEIQGQDAVADLDRLFDRTVETRGEPIYRYEIVDEYADSQGPIGFHGWGWEIWRGILKQLI